MKNENGKKDLLARLIGNRKAKKSSCCCSFEIEEIPVENNYTKDDKKPAKGKGNSCCG